jgi:flavorubredoxin
MKPREIRPNVYYVGAVDWDRRLFDSLIPLPDGTSYNSYLVKGSEKSALVDTVNPPMKETLLDNLDELGLEKLDYVIINHAEPDHSGSVCEVLAKYIEATVVCTPKCVPLLQDRFGIPESRIMTVEDKATLDLGGRTLEFVHTPWVHWPETMATYLREEKILFPCDFFGSHLATSSLYVEDERLQHEGAKRYFAEIMLPFRAIIQNNLKKLEEYDIEIIAPSHGPMYDKAQAKAIMDDYRSWVADEPKNLVLIPYVTMHGITRQMVERLVDGLVKRGVGVKQFDLADSDLGKIAMSLVDAATIVIGTPTVLAGPHPAAAYAAVLANALRPNTKFVSIIGSYGWGGKAVETLTGLIPNIKAEVLPPILCKGYPKEADWQAIDNLAETIAAKHRENNYVS